MPARVPVADFRPDRSQRRCMRRNADLDMSIGPAAYSDECFDLYRRYLDTRHAGGGMDDPAHEDFCRFLFTPWSPTAFVDLRLHGACSGWP